MNDKPGAYTIIHRCNDKKIIRKHIYFTSDLNLYNQVFAVCQIFARILLYQQTDTEFNKSNNELTNTYMTFKNEVLMYGLIFLNSPVYIC